MLNNRGDNFDGQEESEYHFSDEDLNYEVETETPSVEANNNAQPNFISRLSRSKRMLIGLGVFIVLMFVVYKIVSPSSVSTVPSEVITPVTNQAKNILQGASPTQANAAQQQANQGIAPPPVPGSAQQIAEQQQLAAMPNQPAQTTVQQTTTTAEQSAVTTQLTQAGQPQAPMQQQMPQTSPQETMPQQQLPQQQLAPEVMPQQQLQAQQMPMAQMPQQQMPQQQLPQQQLAPEVMPQQQMPQQQMLQSMAPSQTNQLGVQQVAAQQAPMRPPGQTTVMSIPAPSSAYQTVNGQAPPTFDPGTGNMPMNAQQQMSQLQADYVQRLNEFYSQNKLLQEQMQGLASRVVNIETQLNQLVQTLNRQNAPPTNDLNMSQPQSQAMPKLPYNVQAIIPGRAWLRSDSGETITVAEGDAIKDIGRVSKIDPYDGVVEINTGSKVVSLSYGNTG